MLNDNLLPTWQPDSSDSLVDLAKQLKALEQGKMDELQTFVGRKRNLSTGQKLKHVKKLIDKQFQVQ